MEERRPVVILYKVPSGCMACSQLSNIWGNVKSYLSNRFRIAEYNDTSIPDPLKKVLPAHWVPYIAVMDGKTYDLILQGNTPGDIRNKVRIFNGVYGDGNNIRPGRPATLTNITQWAVQSIEDINKGTGINSNVFATTPQTEEVGRDTVCSLRVVARAK